jgi:hypothetical protein
VVPAFLLLEVVALNWLLGLVAPRMFWMARELLNLAIRLSRSEGAYCLGAYVADLLMVAVFDPLLFAIVFEYSPPPVFLFLEFP